MVRSKIEQTGGKRYGVGAYGIVMGDPRSLCDGESEDPVHDGEVSKHFVSGTNARQEYESVMEFYNSLPDDPDKHMHIIRGRVQYCFLG